MADIRKNDIDVRFSNYTLTITHRKRDVDLTTIIPDYSTDYKKYLYAASLVLDRLESKGRVRFGCSALCGRSSTVLLTALSVLSLSLGDPPSRIYIAYKEYLRQYALKYGPRTCPETEFQRMLASSAIAVAEALYHPHPIGLYTATKFVFSGVALVMEPIPIENSGTNAYYTVFGNVHVDPRVGAEAKIIRRLVPLIMEKLRNSAKNPSKY